MKKSRMFTFLQLVCGILAICGVYITALEYRELKTHVEWSTPAYYSLSQADIRNPLRYLLINRMLPHRLLLFAIEAGDLLDLVKMGIVILTAILFTGILQWMKRKR